VNETVTAVAILVACIGASAFWRWFSILRVVTRMLNAPTEYEPFQRQRTPGLGGPSNPTGPVMIDVGMVRRLESALADSIESLRGLEDSVSQSDGQPGVVLRTEPLLVAAYTDEFDAMLVYGFPPGIGAALGLPVGRKLACAATYYSYRSDFDRWRAVPDLVPGPRSSSRWDNTSLIVIDTVSADAEALDRIKAGVPERDWQRLQQLAWAYLAEPKAPVRDGRPSRVFIPAGPTFGWRSRLACHWFFGGV
jgi:hypothetical protein